VSPNEPKPSLLTLRWLVVGTSVAAALSLLIDWMGVSGPWGMLGFGMATVAALAAAALAYPSRHYELHMQEAAEIAERRQARPAGLQPKREPRSPP